jgi:fatty acid-binding protein DegV
MNNHLAVLTDTNSGFSAEAASVYGIEMVPMPVILDGETYYEHQTITQEDFFLRSMPFSKDLSLYFPISQNIL